MRFREWLENDDPFSSSEEKSDYNFLRTYRGEDDDRHLAQARNSSDVNPDTIFQSGRSWRNRNDYPFWYNLKTKELTLGELGSMHKERKASNFRGGGGGITGRIAPFGTENRTLPAITFWQTVSGSVLYDIIKKLAMNDNAIIKKKSPIFIDGNFYKTAEEVLGEEDLSPAKKPSISARMELQKAYHTATAAEKAILRKYMR
jgi:hypothetical protein